MDITKLPIATLLTVCSTLTGIKKMRHTCLKGKLKSHYYSQEVGGPQKSILSLKHVTFGLLGLKKDEGNSDNTMSLNMTFFWNASSWSGLSLSRLSPGQC